MASIKKEIGINVDISPKELAHLFCNMYADEQGSFFNEVARHVSRYWAEPFEDQALQIANSSTINGEGRGIMHILGKYSTTRTE